MTDPLSPERRSELMSRVRSSGTKPELVLRKTLWALGLRYRLDADLPGSPDLAFIGDRVAIFVDGCFWHACPEHGSVPSKNREFWAEKLETNVRRDRRVTAELQRMGWSVLRFWEHDIEESLPDVVARVAEALDG